MNKNKYVAFTPEGVGSSIYFLEIPPFHLLMEGSPFLDRGAVTHAIESILRLTNYLLVYLVGQDLVCDPMLSGKY